MNKEMYRIIAGGKKRKAEMLQFLCVVVTYISLATGRCIPGSSGMFGHLSEYLQHMNITDPTVSPTSTNSTKSPSECSTQQYWFSGECHPCGPLCAWYSAICSRACPAYTVPTVGLTEDQVIRPHYLWVVTAVVGICLLFIAVSTMFWMCARWTKMKNRLHKIRIET